MDGIANGLTCRVSSLTLCTTVAWRCTSLAFFCSTWSHILPFVLLDEQTLTDPILSEANSTNSKDSRAMTVANKVVLTDLLLVLPEVSIA